MGSILDGATGREPFAGEWGRTGATFERATLRDGTPAVIKHVRTDDWLMQAAGGVSYLYRVWQTGLFDRMPTTIDHTMLAMEPDGENFILVMRDASEHVLVEGQVLSRDENRRVLAAGDEMHRLFWGEGIPGIPLLTHYEALTPKGTKRINDVNSPIPELVQRGWEMFDQVGPPDVGEALYAVLDDPQLLVDQLAKHPSTVIHGDFRLHNMGLSPDKLVLLDWEIIGNAPPAVEFAYYLIISASRIDATREQVIEDMREIAQDRFDPAAWDLACIGALMWLGWNKVIDILENPDPAIRAQERADLDWWVSRVRTALETWSPV